MATFLKSGRRPFKVIIDRNRNQDNEYALKIEGASAGKILSIIHALEAAANHSPVASDVLDEIKRARDDAINQGADLLR
jgi:hypothetical protein